jgi:hypothetical protein
MATQGPLYPTAATNVSTGTEINDAWVNPTNVGAADAAEAQITATSYDSPDISHQLHTSGYGFTIPSGATIDGIVVEIERRSIIASSGKDFRVQMRSATGTTIGDNHADVATIWPTSSTIATYGSSSDDWRSGGSWTDTEINDVDFGVVISCQANIANADVGIDFVRVTVHYTMPPQDVNPAALGLSLDAVVPDVVPAPAAFQFTAFQADTFEVAPAPPNQSITSIAPIALSLIQRTAGGWGHEWGIDWDEGGGGMEVNLRAAAASISLTLGQPAPVVVPSAVSIAVPSMRLSLILGNTSAWGTDWGTGWGGMASVMSVTQAGTTVNPAALGLTLTPVAPEVRAAQNVAPAALSLTLSPAAPIVTRPILPAALSLTLTPTAPSVRLRTLPAAVGLTLGIVAPQVARSAQLGALGLTLGVGVPQVLERVTPAPLSLTLSLPVPAALSGLQVAPTGISLTLSRPAPAITQPTSQTVTAPSIGLTLGHPAPAITAGAASVIPAAITLSLSHPAPVVVPSGIDITPAALGLVLGLPAPALFSGAGLVIPAAIGLSLGQPALLVFTGPPAPGPIVLVLTPLGPELVMVLTLSRIGPKIGAAAAGDVVVTSKQGPSSGGAPVGDILRLSGKGPS